MTRTHAPLARRRLAAVLSSAALALALAHAARADVASVGDVEPPLPAPDGSGNVAQTVPGGMSIGVLGSGAVIVTGGASYTLDGTGALFVANLGGASGLLSATGAGSLVDLRIPASVGHGEAFTQAEDGFDAGIVGAPTAGRVRILGGARLASVDLALGLFAPGAPNPSAGFGDGTLEVAGAGSAAAIAGVLEAGVMGEGHVTVQDGAQVTATALAAGEADIGTGTIEVRAPGARLEATDDLQVGVDGHASLEVTGGGALVTPGLARVGQGQPTGRGEALVSGPGSLWSSGGGSATFLRVGQDGADGALTVEDGARLEVHDRFDANLANFTGAQLLLGQNGTASVVFRSGAQVLVTRDLPGNGSAQIQVGGLNTVPRGAASLEVKDAGTSVTVTGSGTGPGGVGVQAAVLSVGANLAIGAARISDGARVLVDGRTAAGGLLVVARDGALGQVEVDTGASVRLAGGAGGAQEGTFSIGDRAPPVNLAGAVGVLRVGADALLEATLGSVGRRLGTTGTAVVEARGEIRLAGAASNGAGATLSVGRDGADGALDVLSDGQDGGLVTIDGAAGAFPGLRIGVGAASSLGAVRVAGPGALVRVLSASGTGQVAVGQDGAGSLEVTAGGRVLAGQDLELGRAAGASGEAVIDGAGSEVLVEETQSLASSAQDRSGPVALVGRAGAGTLTVRSGGRLTVRPAAPVDADQITGVLVGGSAAIQGGSGLLVVSGAGSRVDVDSPRAFLFVGRAGAGELRIEGGAVAAIGGAGRGVALVGAVPTASGAVLVSGTASRLEVGSLLGIGRALVTATSEALEDGGAGAVALEDGGALAAPTVEVGPFGTLSGTGTLEGALVLLGGRVAPGTAGGAAGTLSVSGAVSVSSGAIQVEVRGAAPGESDLLDAGGVVAFSGGAIALVPSGGHAIAQGDRVRAVRAGGGFTGLASVTVTGLPAGTDALLVQTGDALEVRVVPAGEGGVAAGDDGSGNVHADHHGGGCAIAPAPGGPARARRVPAALAIGVLAPWGALVAILFALRRRARVRSALRAPR